MWEELSKVFKVDINNSFHPPCGTQQMQQRAQAMMHQNNAHLQLTNTILPSLKKQTKQNYFI